MTSRTTTSGAKAARSSSRRVPSGRARTSWPTPVNAVVTDARMGSESSTTRTRAGRSTSGPRSGVGAQDVPDPAHRVDEARLALGLGLAPQVADVDLEGVAGGREVVAPDLLEDAGARQDPARVRDEQLEQRELGAGERDRPFAAADVAGDGVQGQVREHQRVGVLVAGALLRRGPAQQRPQPREELLEGERLGQVV